MIKYKVIKNCFGFKRRLWEAGQIVELEDNDQPPHHFVRFDVGKVEQKIARDPMAPKVVDHGSLSSIGKPPENKVGFASSLPEPIDLTVKRKAGRPFGSKNKQPMGQVKICPIN